MQQPPLIILGSWRTSREQDPVHGWTRHSWSNGLCPFSQSRGVYVWVRVYMVFCGAVEDTDTALSGDGYWMDGWIPVSRAGLLKKRGITFSESCHSRWCNLSCLVLKIPGSRKSQPPLWLCWSPHYNILNARGSLRPKIQTAGRQVKTTSLLKTNWQLTRKSVQLREIHPMISKPKSQGMTIRQKGAQDHEHTKRKMIGQVQHIRVEHVSCTSGNNKGRN